MGNAILANKLGRATYHMLRKGTAFDAELGVGGCKRRLKSAAGGGPKVQHFPVKPSGACSAFLCRVRRIPNQRTMPGRLIGELHESAPVDFG